MGDLAALQTSKLDVEFVAAIRPLSDQKERESIVAAPVLGARPEYLQSPSREQPEMEHEAVPAIEMSFDR